MKNQQKLVLGILATDNKIDKTQFAQGLKILETLPAEDAGKLNWIAKEFTLTKDDILTAFERSKELTSKHGNAESAFLSLSLDSNPASDEEDKGEVSIKLPRTESEISIQKGPTRLSGKSAYQTPESIGESKIKHAPKLKKQQIFGQDSSRFIDLDDSVVSEDEGLFKSSDSERPLSDIKPPSGVKPKLKRGSSKIIEPKKIV